MAVKKDPYELLGLEVQEISDLKDDKKALKKKALGAWKKARMALTNMDPAPENIDDLQAELLEARSIIMDPEKRAVFEKGGHEKLQENANKGSSSKPDTTDYEDLDKVANDWGVDISNDPDDLFGDIVTAPKSDEPKPRRGRQSIKEVRKQTMAEQLDQQKAEEEKRRKAIEDKLNKNKTRASEALVMEKRRDVFVPERQTSSDATVEERPAPKQNKPTSNLVDLSSLIDDAETAIDKIKKAASSITSKEDMEDASHDVDDLANRATKVARDLLKKSRRL